MTGKDLIIYILKNNLEDTEVFKNGTVNPEILGLVSVRKKATDDHVGINFIEALCKMGRINFVTVNGSKYVLQNELEKGSVKK